MQKCKGGHLCQIIGTVINHEDYAKQNVDKKKLSSISVTNLHSFKTLAKVIVLVMKPLDLQ